MSKELFISICGVLSVILAVCASIPYILYIISGRTKPHQLTWLVFSIMNGIIFLSQYLKGGRASVLISLVFFVSSFVEFLLSLHYGTRNTSRWDRTLFVMSLLTIVAWVLTKNPSVAIWLTVVIDIFATSMMLLKIKAQPDSEAMLPWAIAAVAYVFSMMSLANKSLGILYVRPIYGFLSDALTVGWIYYLLRTRAKGLKSKTNSAPVAALH